MSSSSSSNGSDRSRGSGDVFLGRSALHFLQHNQAAKAIEQFLVCFLVSQLLVRDRA